MKIQPVVEGDGEVAAVPVLLRRLLQEINEFEVEVGAPIKAKRAELGTQVGLDKWVGLARKQDGCAAVLVLFDSDDDCPKEVFPDLQAWATAAAAPLPCQIVLAHREFEAWLLAGVEALRGVRHVRDDAVAPHEPEVPRDCKGRLESLMEPEFGYAPPADQPALTRHFDMAAAHRACRSFRRLTKAFTTIVNALGVDAGEWPPDSWQP